LLFLRFQPPYGFDHRDSLDRAVAVAVASTRRKGVSGNWRELLSCFLKADPDGKNNSRLSKSATARDTTACTSALASVLDQLVYRPICMIFVHRPQPGNRLRRRSPLVPRDSTRFIWRPLRVL
jgi:hypothetical protein